MPLVPILGAVGVGGFNATEDVFNVQARLSDLGFAWLATDGRIGPGTISVIKLFQAIKNGRQQVNLAVNDGRIDPNGDSHRWLQASNAPGWTRIPDGSLEEGFVNSEPRNQPDSHDFGSTWLVDTLRAAGAHYLINYMDSHPSAPPITINDAARPRGGDTMSHKGHETGLSCDIRLPHKDGNIGGIKYTSAKYDRNAMRAMLKGFKQQTLSNVILFNDPVLIGERLCKAATGHDNHAHLQVKPPTRHDDNF